MFVWRFRFALVDGCAAARFLPAKASFTRHGIAALARHQRSAGYGLDASHDTAQSKVGTVMGLTQKAFERAHRRAMLRRLDWGIPPVAHHVGCTVKRHRFAFRFGTRTMPLERHVWGTRQSRRFFGSTGGFAVCGIGIRHTRFGRWRSQTVK
jgi:hypothetical protein